MQRRRSKVYEKETRRRLNNMKRNMQPRGTLVGLRYMHGHSYFRMNNINIISDPSGL